MVWVCIMCVGVRCEGSYERGGCGVWGEDTHVITTLQNGPGVVASGRILIFTTHTDSSSYQ